jgi:hypothetical protein
MNAKGSKMEAKWVPDKSITGGEKKSYRMGEGSRGSGTDIQTPVIFRTKLYLHIHTE